MSEDRRRPEQYASRRDEVLREWIAESVYPYSRTLRDRFERVGLARQRVRSVADLSVLNITARADLADGTDWVLEPTADAVAAHGGLWLRARLAVGDVLGTKKDFIRREIDAPYKPISWSLAEGLLVASTTSDIERLAKLGRRALAIAGVRSSDRILLLGAATSDLASQQVLLGAWDAGVAVLHTDHATGSLPSTVTPTLVAGPAERVREAAAGGLAPSVRGVVAWTDAADPVSATADLDGLGVEVSRWWSPPGTRAAWAGCPGGAGFHTWPVEEYIEIQAAPGATSGRVVWSPVGWRGSVWLRVDLGILGRLDTAACPTCGRTTPRLVPTPTGAAASPTPAMERPSPPDVASTPAPAPAPPGPSTPVPTPPAPRAPDSAPPAPLAAPEPTAEAGRRAPEPGAAVAPDHGVLPEPAVAIEQRPVPVSSKKLPPVSDLVEFEHDWIAATIAGLPGVSDALLVTRRGRPGVLLVLAEDADPDVVRGGIDALVRASIRAVSARRLARIRAALGPVWVAAEADVTAVLSPAPESS